MSKLSQGAFVLLRYRALYGSLNVYLNKTDIIITSSFRRVMYKCILGTMFHHRAINADPHKQLCN